ncbi:hypothetical protein SLNWT_4125 [Streptomyces albus]|uniref:Uncharacterized protein n=1 Tax=Streptomyces albus (strain ATCC 21838 / DSM 41398 / FERM P-419 / JCM 4703 / NBRC 107858) TaxID=1081613 RepID=A0A0B5F0V0_STRA4|nr:hypothetical protein SLNWT_4125 [Streptomyces albus]AOU78811.1 hypothetical protein SLNHY_4120 [Streptomyces albus]AYN34545.1 hypothetical protein DUI70_4046 [Streptomyces albus]
MASSEEAATGPVLVCSLKVSAVRTIPDDGKYHLVRFPFGTAESSDEHGMHQVAQPDGHTVKDWTREDRAGLIWPARSGWGELYAMVQWESGNYSELRDQFVRDPLGLTDAGVDTTATDHRVPSPGRNYFTKTHGIFVKAGTPLGLRVAQRSGRSQKLLLAEFKLVIRDA